jgi:hypothetical protein
MARIVRFTLVLGAVFVVAGGMGCGSNGTSTGTGGQGGVSASGGAVGGAGGAATGGAPSGSGGATTATGGSVGGAGGAATGGSPSGSGGATTATGGSAGGDASAWPNVGVCGERGSATADATSYDGYEERFIISEEGFGTDVCVVRFDLKRVGDAPAGCTACSWTHLLEYSNPKVVTDTNGVCAKSDLGLASAAIAKIVGTRIAIGYANQYQGAHGSARMKYFEDKKLWDVAGNATWSESSKAFSYTFRDGYCNYGP